MLWHTSDFLAVHWCVTEHSLRNFCLRSWLWIIWDLCSVNQYFNHRYRYVLPQKDKALLSSVWRPMHYDQVFWSWSLKLEWPTSMQDPIVSQFWGRSLTTFLQILALTNRRESLSILSFSLHCLIMLQKLLLQNYKLTDTELAIGSLLDAVITRISTKDLVSY